MTMRATSWTKFLVCQDLDTPSHFSGVVTITADSEMALRVNIKCNTADD